MNVQIQKTGAVGAQICGNDQLATLRSCGGQITCERLENGEYGLKFEREVRRGLFQKVECRDGLSKVVRTGWQASNLSVQLNISAEALDKVGLGSSSVQEVLSSLAKHQGRKHLFNGYGEVGKSFAEVLSSGTITEFVNARIKSTETREFNFTNCAVQNSWVAGRRVGDEIVSQQIVPRGPRSIKSPLQDLTGPAAPELGAAEIASAHPQPESEPAGAVAASPALAAELGAPHPPSQRPGWLRKAANFAGVIFGGAALIFSFLKSNHKEAGGADIAIQHDRLRARDSVEQVIRAQAPVVVVVADTATSPGRVKHELPSARSILRDDQEVLAHSTFPALRDSMVKGSASDTTLNSMLSNSAGSDTSSSLPQTDNDLPSSQLDMAVIASTSVGAANFSSLSLTGDRFQARYLESSDHGSAVVISTKLSAGSTDRVLLNGSLGVAVEAVGTQKNIEVSPSFEIGAQSTRSSGNFEWTNRVQGSYTPFLEGGENAVVLENSLEGTARSQGTFWIKSGKIIGTSAVETEYRNDRLEFRGVEARSEFYIPAIAQPAIPKDLVFRPFVGSFYSKSDEQRSHRLGIGLGVDIDGRLKNTYLDGGLSFEDDPLALSLRGGNVHWRMKLSQRLSPQFGLFVAGQGGRATGFLEERTSTSMFQGWRAGFDLNR